MRFRAKLILMVLAQTAQCALAQAATDGVTPSSPTDQLQEVVVTAEKRSERLQDVPVSAQVFGAQALSQRNVVTLSGLSGIDPSIHVGVGGPSNQLYIRGTGSGGNQAFDQSVGTFVDDMYYGRSRTTEAPLFDLDHIEVLKGPQSTFFGNNAIAGALNIITMKPADDFGGYVRLLGSPEGGTNGGQYAAEGAVNVPLMPELSVRLAGIADGQRGWLFNEHLDSYGPKENSEAGRITVRYQPSGRLEMLLKAEVDETRNHSGLYLQSYSCPPPAPFVASGFCAVNLAAGAPQGINNNRDSSNGGLISLSEANAELTTIYAVPDAGTVTSVTGFYNYHYTLNLDADGTASDLLNIAAPEQYHQFSGELRYASRTGGTLEYMAGLYFQSDGLDLTQSQTYGFLTPTIGAAPPLAPLDPYLPLAQLVAASQEEGVYSGFGSVTWNMTDTWRLVGGLRGTWAHKSFAHDLVFGTGTQEFGGVVPLPATVAPLADVFHLAVPGQQDLSRTDHALLPSAKLEHRWRPDLMTYLSYARGFKAGGFNVADSTGIAANLPFSPEHVNAYELGLKAEFDQRRVLTDIAVFRSDYSDLQVSIQTLNGAGSFINLVRNAAASRSQGVEFSTEFLVTPSFRLAAAGTYLDSYFVSYPDAGPTTLQTFEGMANQDLSGAPTPFAPKWSGSLSAAYARPVWHDFRLIVEGTGILSTPFNLSQTGDPFYEQPGYGRLDARITLQSPDRRWAFDIIGNNLTSTTIRTFQAPLALSTGSFLAQREQPRNIAFQARYSF